ncbi:MAG TPA: NifU N-terminal domain-containing protein [Bacillota bacterium]
MADLEIRAEPTPNPNSVKFTLNRTLTDGRSRTYNSADEAADDPLARALFAVPGVEMVFLLNNFITVRKAGSSSWHDLVPQLERAIREHLSDGR